jgi:hypothetical protein
MRDLNHDFKNLCQRNRDGSFATHEGGFRHLRATGCYVRRTPGSAGS